MDTIFKMLLAMVGQGLVTAGIALCCWYLLLHQLHKEHLRHQDRMEQEDRDVD
jgi:hypothetical protein